MTDAHAGHDHGTREALGLDPARMNIMQAPVPSLDEFDPSFINARLVAARKNPFGDSGIVWYRTDVPVLMSLLGHALAANNILEEGINEALRATDEAATTSALLAALAKAAEVLK